MFAPYIICLSQIICSPGCLKWGCVREIFCGLHPEIIFKTSSLWFPMKVKKQFSDFSIPVPPRVTNVH